MLLLRGTQMIIAGVVVVFFAVIAQIALALMIGNRARLIGSLAVLAGNVLIVIGSWWLTMPDPSGIGEDKYGTARKIIRITLVIGIVNTLIALVPTLTTLPPDLSQLVTLVGGIAALIGIVGMFAQLQYFEKLGDAFPTRCYQNVPPS